MNSSRKADHIVLLVVSVIVRKLDNSFSMKWALGLGGQTPVIGGSF